MDLVAGWLDEVHWRDTATVAIATLINLASQFLSDLISVQYQQLTSSSFGLHDFSAASNLQSGLPSASSVSWSDAELEVQRYDMKKNTFKSLTVDPIMLEDEVWTRQHEKYPQITEVCLFENRTVET